MSYPFIHATEDYGTRKGPIKAFVVHMAEGGGTVGFLSNPTVPRGVSVHYVIEATGRIVRMLDETHASGSIDPTKIRTDDDADGFYGATKAKAVMGDWWRDPNAAVISLEIEGFATVGPNAAQHGSLKTLVADVRSRHPGIGLLGHRDFANYKACPGRLVHWDDIGGHGPQEADVYDIDVARPEATLIDLPAGTAILNLDGTTRTTLTTARKDVRSPFVTTSDGGTALRAIVYTRPKPTPDLLLAVYGNAAQNVRAADCADAVAAEHERVRDAAIAAVTAIP